MKEYLKRKLEEALDKCEDACGYLITEKAIAEIGRLLIESLPAEEYKSPSYQVPIDDYWKAVGFNKCRNQMIKDWGDEA